MRKGYGDIMTNIEKFQAVLPEYGDAALITSAENQLYLTDFPFEDGFVLITKKNAYLVCDFRYIEDAKHAENGWQAVLFAPGKRLATVSELLANENCKTLAFEDGDVCVGDFELFKKALGNVEWSPLENAMTVLRECKNEEEVSRIKEAQRITDAAFQYILGRINPSMTETDVALELEYYMRQHGGQSAAFQTIAISGDATSVPHGVPKPRKLQPGFLTMDFGCQYKGYKSDMTRTIVIGKATDEMKKVYNTVLTAQSAVLQVISEGCDCMEMDKVARDIINNAGYEGCFGHGLGHGVGVLIHESPNLSPLTKNKKLAPGNVVTVEPGIYLEGKFGVRIEDMVIVGNGCAEDITESPKDLIEIL